MFDGFHTGMGAGGWLLMSLFWIALLALAAWAIARVAPSRRGDRSPAAEEPLAILDRRLARGEIDGDTYDQLRGKLSSRPADGMG